MNKSLILLFNELHEFEDTVSFFNREQEEFHPFLMRVEIAGTYFFAIRFEFKVAPLNKGPDDFLLAYEWERRACAIYIEGADGLLSEYKKLKHRIKFEAVVGVLHRDIANGWPIYEKHPGYPAGWLEGKLPKRTKKAPAKPRGNAGEKHYTAGHESQQKKMVDDYCKKANGLFRLEVALFKWLGENSGTNPKIRAALDQARAAQQDTDFQPLWDLLDERARNAGTCGTEEHY